MSEAASTPRIADPRKLSTLQQFHVSKKKKKEVPTEFDKEMQSTTGKKVMEHPKIFLLRCSGRIERGVSKFTIPSQQVEKAPLEECRKVSVQWYLLSLGSAVMTLVVYFERQSCLLSFHHLRFLLVRKGYSTTLAYLAPRILQSMRQGCSREPPSFFIPPLFASS